MPGIDTKLQQLGFTRIENLGTYAQQAYARHNNQLMSMSHRDVQIAHFTGPMYVIPSNVTNW